MTTYYLDNLSPAANDSNSGTSATAPLASLSALGKISLQPGDVIAIKAGTVYNVNAPGAAALTISASGTAGSPITITSYGSGAKPIINNTSTTLYSDGIYLKNAHDVTISGIAFGSASQAAVNIDAQSSDIKVQNNEMTNVGEGVLVKGTNNLITGNDIHDLHMVKNTPKDTTSAATLAATSNDDYGANGVVVAGSSNEISYNRIVNAKATSYDYGADGGGIELFGGMTDESIHDNYVTGSQGFIELGGYESTISNINIYNNVSYDNGTFLVLHNGGGAFASQFSNLEINNNTIVDDNNASKSMGNVFLDATATASQINVNHNIFVLNDGDSIFKQPGTYHSDNLFDLEASDTHLYNNWDMTLGTGELYGDPGLSGAANGDFTPTSAMAQGLGASVGAKLQTIISGQMSATDTTNFAQATPSYDVSVTPNVSLTIRDDGSRVNALQVSGQTVQSNFHDVMLAQGLGGNTFVFQPGYGHDIIRGFVASGSEHDMISLPQSDFTDIADVLRHTQNTTAGAVIHDSASGEFIRLVGVNKTELVHNQADFSFHA